MPPLHITHYSRGFFHQTDNLTGVAMKQYIIKSLESILALFLALTLIVACEDSGVLQDNSPPRG